MNEVDREARGHRDIWNGRIALAVSITLALGLTVALPGVGVLGAFAIAILFVVAGRRSGSLDDIGMRAPGSWPRLLAITFGYGLVIQLAFTIVVDPLFGRLTGREIDISAFDAVRGSFGNFLVLFAVGWIVGGFLEELTFRGFVVTRVRHLLGSGRAATWSAVALSATVFGLAHFYQGAAGMLSTGAIGLLLGAVFVRHGDRIWYAVFTHGFVNSVAIVLIYLDKDRQLGSLLF